MKLIKKIEIWYFRSIYDGEMSDLADLNVIFGRNDTGKSNVLRALNLFFNYESNPGLVFNFDRDFSHERKHEVETDKGAGSKKFVTVKVTFATPKNMQKSLGKEFFLRRQWSIERNPTAPQEKFSKHITQNKIQYVRRFLNNVSFHYIPAIKDRVIFQKLLEEMYKVLLKDEDFVNSLSGFTEKIRAKTEALSSGIADNLKIASVIAPPDDLSNLFRSLDFDTGKSNSKLSLILQRGDGVQVRHIPEILRFIADAPASPSRHIWGFEEPENSLELAGAVGEAKLFCDLAEDENKQIFITSHSPAFFRLPEPIAKKFFVKKQDEKSEIVNISDSDDMDSFSLMGEIPYLSVISDALNAAHAEIEELKFLQKDLQKQIEGDQRPILWVEGQTDKQIIECAWKLFSHRDLPLNVKPASGAEPFSAFVKKRGFIEETFGSRKIFILTDNDPDGRKPFTTKRLQKGVWDFSASGAYWCHLRPTDEYVDWRKKYGVPTNNVSFTIECCFSADLRRQALDAGEYKHDDLYGSLVLPEPWARALSRADTKLSHDDSDVFYSRTPHKDYKDKFAKWVTAPDRVTWKNYLAFEEIINGLDKLVE
jgi:predicted ATPase